MKGYLFIYLFIWCVEHFLLTTPTFAASSGVHAATGLQGETARAGQWEAAQTRKRARERDRGRRREGEDDGRGERGRRKRRHRLWPKSRHPALWAPLNESLCHSRHPPPLFHTFTTLPNAFRHLVTAFSKLRTNYFIHKLVTGRVTQNMWHQILREKVHSSWVCVYQRTRRLVNFTTIGFQSVQIVDEFLQLKLTHVF